MKYQKGFAPVIALVSVIAILAGASTYYFTNQKTNNANSAASDKKEMEQPQSPVIDISDNKPETLEKDFGILKFKAKLTSDKDHYLGDKEPDIFKKDFLSSYLAVYSEKEDGRGDNVKAIIQNYKGNVSYSPVYENMLKKAQKGIQNKRVTMEQHNFKNGKYFCYITLSEGQRCMWASDNKLVLVEIELSPELISKTTSLKASWEKYLNAYLEKYAPSN
jgi:hypothetical protein